jgi:tetratricopeptide (TPR) repeat protein
MIYPQSWQAMNAAVHASNSRRSSSRTTVRASLSVPHMFLSSARLWSGTLWTGSDPAYRYPSSTTTTTEQQQLQLQQLQLQRTRSQGVLGFAVYDDLETAAEQQQQQQQHSHSSSSLTTMYARRPSSSGLSSSSTSNVDSTQWNLPQSIDSSSPLNSFSLSGGSSGTSTIWRTSTRQRLAETADTWGWFPWIPTHQQIAALRVTDLKRACAERGLVRTGLKADLSSRLLEWTKEQIGQRHALLQEQERSVGTGFGEFLNFNINDGNGDVESTSTTESDPVVATPEKRGKLGGFTAEKQQAQQQQHLEANSLGEWARTVDLKPLLKRREAIHREKRQGKTVVVKSDHSPKTPTREYLLALVELFEKPSSSAAFSNNLQVQQMYAAAKQADQIGDRALSRRILLQLKEATPHDARIYRRLARMEKEDGNLAAARAILQEGLRLHPDNAFLWHGLGQFAASDADTKKCWRKAIASDPSLPHPYHALGTLEHTQGRIANAMKTLKKGIEYCPTNHRLHHALGDLYRDAKMLDMAERCYRKALEHGPPVSYGFAFTALAYVAYEKGEVDECRSWLRKAVSLNNGRHANGWVALAQMEESEGNIDAARAVCIAALTQYERGLFEQSRKISVRFRPKRTQDVFEQLDADSLRSKFLKTVPQYRSGDRFFNVYRNWARLEERYGTVESVEDVYKRASLAFPGEWKLAIDWSQYCVKMGMHDHARQLFTEACTKAANRHADPYRLFAAFEMSIGNYDDARKILYRGSVAMSQSMDGGMDNRCGMPELFHTWAVCEWHLGELTRAEVLFDHALRMTNAGDEGSKLRSFILYSIARLEHFRGEPILAQHCIGLCLKENLMPGGNSKIWELWADVATEMGNEVLAAQCEEQAEQAKSHEDENGPAGLSRLLALKSPDASSSGLISRMKGPDMEQLMRRDPWHQKIFDMGQRSRFFHGVRLPEKEERTA